MQHLVFVFILFCAMSGYAQSSMVNSSFEGDPQDATVPTGWHACEPGSTPDIMPGPWQVYLEASQGDTYLGLITRGDGSWESIGQRLSAPLEKNECYKFSIDLAHSRNYAGYNLPIKLRIWGAVTKCEKGEIIGESKLINHQDWRTYNFEFNTKEKYNYIILEAFYGTGKLVKYQGNILIDSLSKIIPCSRA